LPADAEVDASAHYRCVVPFDDAARSVLLPLLATGRLASDHWLERDGSAVVVLSGAEVELLRGLNLAVMVGDNLEEQSQRVRAETASTEIAGEGGALQIGFVDEYLDVSAIYARYEALHAEFPALTQLSSLPHLTSGYDGAASGLAGAAPVKLFRLTTTPGAVSKPGLLLVAGTHAREWIPPLAAIEFVEQLLRNFSPGSAEPAVQAINAIVEGLDVLVVPVLNPDGMRFSHNDQAMWRKNRRVNPSAPACPGVDVNRNYPIFWGEAGSSATICNESYRGPSATSEQENRNILHLLEHFPNVLTAVDCHSFGEDIFRAHPNGGLHIPSQPVEPADNDVFLALESAMNAAISSVTPGKVYSTGTTNNHAGTCDDFLFLAHRIFGFTVECGQDFQPAIDEGLVAVQEVAAALRALATETLSLASRFVFSTSIVHVVDRSGSMVASGYDQPALANARRLVDLMSLNDLVSVVSFNQSATTHLGLTPITGPDVYVTARAAANAITFGGATSIGAGLAAAGAQLSGASGARAVILLSDGYENRPPSVASILPTLPEAVPVFAIALGPASDQALLESIADDTGGAYKYSPDDLDLYEIYNYCRAEASGEELALNQRVAVPDGEEVLNRAVTVDDGCVYATFTASWPDPEDHLVVTVRPPRGPVMDLRRARRVDSAGYAVVRVRRPQTGRWSMEIRGARAGAQACTVAAFLRSDLRLRLVADGRDFVVGKPLRLLVRLTNGGSIRGTASVTSPSGTLATLLKDPKLPVVPLRRLQAPDALPKVVQQALMIRERRLRATGKDPLRSVERPGTFVRVGNAGEAVASLAVAESPGSYNLKVRVEGRSKLGGNPFVRVGAHTILVK
jgi:predicted deacylase